MRTPQDLFVRFLVDNVSITATFSGRSELLEGIPNRENVVRSEEILLKDLQAIVRYVCVERRSLGRLVQNAAMHLQPHEIPELEKLAAAMWTRPAVPAIDLGAPHRFDLNGVMEECMPKIHRHRGLIGFTLHSTCDRLIHALIDRIKDEMSTRGAARPHRINTLGGLNDVPSAIAVLKKMRAVLAVQDIVCGGVVFDGIAARLWDEARAEFAAHCPNRLVLLLMTREPAVAPAGMFALPTPVFHVHHAESWWREVVRVQRWSGVHLSEILEAYSPRADDDDRLDMDSVYEDLKDAMDLLRNSKTEDGFHEAWVQRYYREPL